MIGYSTIIKDRPMTASTATIKEKDILQLTLSPNLNLSITTTAEQTPNAEPELKLIKEEYKQVGSQKLLRRAVIQLTLSEYLQLKSSFHSIDSFIKFVSHNAQRTNTGNNENQEHQTSQATPKIL